MGNTTRAGRQCAGCTEWITPGPRERNIRKWCSERCRTATYYRKNPDKAREQRTKNRQRKRDRTAQRGPRDWMIICRQCGGVFFGRRRDQKYCRQLCSTRAYQDSRRGTERYREQRRRTSYRRRIRGVAVKIDPVERLHVYERDGWVCQLCFRPTDREYDNSNPWSPTIDHVVALTDEGHHVEENLQLAHHICNSIKSDGDFDPTVLARFEMDLAA